MSRILGVDPGLTRCGVGVIDAAGARTVSFVHVSVIRSAAELPLEQRLLTIRNGLVAVLDEFPPDVIAIERVFAQHNVRSVIGTAQVAGIALMLAAERGLAVALHTPSEVKAAVTGYGRADKNQVTAMVTAILKLDAPPKPADAADALALAICHAWRGGTSALAGETAAQRAWRTALGTTRS
ncbi:MAG: crossover junction endodeoxyribonuclease RuvC [Microbacteriaceae bacterium]|nr:crossover junction endodeoxyribonuclease RuvC [Microbacteriaceae bacterium]